MKGALMDWRNSGWNGLLHLLAGVVLAIASGLPGPVLAQSGSSAVYYLHTDHLNTPRLVTDEQNTVVWRSLPLAEPFGNTPPEEDPDGNGIPFSMNLRFPGQYADKETNTNYNYFRDYNPQTGRYIQSDPIGLQGGINTYAYVLGNPISKIDPMGLETEEGPEGPYSKDPRAHFPLPPGNSPKGRDYWKPVCEAASKEYGDWVKPICKACVRYVCEDTSARPACCAVRKDKCMGENGDSESGQSQCMQDFALCIGRMK